jgi:polyisoprenoid-binding protein YceI
MCFASIGFFQADSETTTRPAASARQEAKEVPPTPVPVEDGKVALDAKNTTIQFVGTHVGPKPDPRTGYFSKFSGELAVHETAKAPESVTLEIDTASLVTPIGRLTGHLHSPDFFDVRRYPKATFESTKIEAVDTQRGRYKITGDLTIREVTKPVSLPATVKVTGDGLVLASKFKIKRSDFGINFGPDRVVDDVALTVTVGKPTPNVRPE